MSIRPNVSAHFETNLLQLIAESGIAKINMLVAILIIATCNCLGKRTFLHFK